MDSRRETLTSNSEVVIFLRHDDVTQLRYGLESGIYYLYGKDENLNGLLHMAVLHRSFEVLKMLLREFNMRVQTKNNRGLTPVHLACINNDFAVLKILIKNKSPYILDVSDNLDLTPMLYAYRNNNRGLVKMLHSRGCRMHVGREIPYEYINSLYITSRMPLDVRRHLQRQNRVNTRSPISHVQHRQNHQHRLREQDFVVPLPVVHQDIAEVHIKEDEVSVPTFHINEHIEMMVELKKTCPICFTEFQKENTILLKCFHALCTGCHTIIKNSDKKECPMRCGPL